MSRPLRERARAAPISRAEPAPPFSHFPLLFHSPNPTAAASPTLPLGNVNFERQGSICSIQYFSLLIYFCIPSLTAYQLPEKTPPAERLSGLRFSKYFFYFPMALRQRLPSFPLLPCRPKFLLNPIAHIIVLNNIFKKRGLV